MFRLATVSKPGYAAGRTTTSGELNPNANHVMTGSLSLIVLKNDKNILHHKISNNTGVV